MAFPLMAALSAAVALSTLALAAPASAMDFSYRIYKERYLVIEAVGVIENDDYRKLELWLRGLPDNVRWLVGYNSDGNAIVFNSPGGRIPDAVEIGKYIERSHFSTGVAAGGQCASACVVAWAAGAQRSAAPGSRIGVHSAAFKLVAGQSVFDRLAAYDTTGAMARWFYDHGAPDNVVNKTLDTPADDMYWLTADDLAAWNVRITD